MRRTTQAILLVAALFGLALVGCSRGKGAIGGAPSRRVALALEARPETGGTSSCDLAYAALEDQVRRRGGSLVEGAEAQAPRLRGPGLDARCLYSRLDGRDAEQLLRVLAEEGRDLVVAVGATLSGGLARVALEYPRVRFAYIAPSLGPAGGLPDGAANLTIVRFDGAQAAFLVGALAGYMVSNEKKPRLGFIGGADASPVHAFQAGFQAGAAYAAPELRKGGGFLAQYCGRYDAAFSDPEIAHAIADSQFKKGAHIVFHAAGASGRGLFEAARGSGRLAMGSGTDRAVDPVIAVATERADVALSALIEELFSSGTVKGGVRVLGIKDEAVGYELSESRGDELAPFARRLEELRARVVSGEISVPSDGEALARFIKGLK
jgi:basic membrane protein A